MLDNIFSTFKNDVRISIFKDIGWTRVFVQYFFINIRHPLVWIKGPNIVHCPRWGKYIRVSERVGSENPKSKTYFYFSKTTRRDCEGIAAVVRQSGLEQTIPNLPDINMINLNTIDLTRNTRDANNVKRYMKETFATLETLRRLQTKARHFHATILLNEDATTEAVLVIDSTSEQSPFNDHALDKISGYVKLFSTTF